MAKAVWKLNEAGRRAYVGHVPEGYKLKEGEYFGTPPKEVWRNKVEYTEVIRDA